MKVVVEIDEHVWRAENGSADSERIRSDIEDAMHDAGFENVLLSVRIGDDE